MNPRASILLSCLALSLIALTGCFRNSPNAPAASRIAGSTVSAFAAAAQDQNGFFPLRIGNRWHSGVVVRAGSIPADGGPVNSLEFGSDIVRLIVGIEAINGNSYSVEQDSTNEQAPPGGESFVNWIRYRQDRSGLYEADVASNLPPVPGGGPPPTGGANIGPETGGRGLPSSLAVGVPENDRARYEEAWGQLLERAEVIRLLGRTLALPGAAGRPGGVRAGELMRLAYPLHPGQHWIVRSDPDLLFTSEVEANELVEVPAGTFPSSRIRIQSNVFGPNDRVHIWFGRSGILALRYHAEFAVTDDDGNVLRTMFFDYDETLRELSLVAP